MEKAKKLGWPILLFLLSSEAPFHIILAHKVSIFPLHLFIYFFHIAAVGIALPTYSPFYFFHLYLLPPPISPSLSLFACSTRKSFYTVFAAWFFIVFKSNA